ncbi:hypothetical protein AALO_G00019980 [Alosa alosa]|uniref:Uncharacterized protein n=1 Tax=Alosa alosa TaxID=278164 RepID=A0AAV6HLR7_9TELE|nr:hypothetical protein AALO_G00019980 [Alosa alosa]
MAKHRGHLHLQFITDQTTVQTSDGLLKYNVASSFSTGKDLHGLENTEPIEVQEGSLVCSAAPLPRQDEESVQW